jgi:hypothetical protein
MSRLGLAFMPPGVVGYPIGGLVNFPVENFRGQAGEVMQKGIKKFLANLEVRTRKNWPRTRIPIAAVRRLGLR